jgi:hypothetical protein
MERDYTILGNLGDRAYVLGKGKSIDGLTPSHFDPDVPVFCANEAVMFAESLGIQNTIIGVRQDGKNRYYCPKRAWMLIKLEIIAYYTSYANTIPWSYHSLGIEYPTTTIPVILLFLKLLGISNVTLYGIDAQVTSSLTYSDCADAGDKARINNHLIGQTNQMRDYSKGLNCKWMHPDLENYQTVL